MKHYWRRKNSKIKENQPTKLDLPEGAKIWVTVGDKKVRFKGITKLRLKKEKK